MISWLEQLSLQHKGLPEAQKSVCREDFLQGVGTSSTSMAEDHSFLYVIAIILNPLILALFFFFFFSTQLSQIV